MRLLCSISLLMLTGCGSEPGPASGSEQDGGDRGSRPCDERDSEPNDAEDEAEELIATPPHGCDYTTSVQGTLAGGDDIDTYVVPGVDKCAGTDGVEVTFEGTFSGLRMCLYGDCAIGTEVAACPGGERERSPEGRVGCCSFNRTTVLDLDCGSGSTLVHYYMRVEQPASGACYPYTFRFRYR